MTMASRLSKMDFSILLQEPFKQHQGAAVESITVADLLQISDRLPELIKTDSIGLPANKTCVLHAVVFHVLGGYDANLPPPSPTSKEALEAEAFICGILSSQKVFADRPPIRWRRFEPLTPRQGGPGVQVEVDTLPYVLSGYYGIVW